MTAILIRRIVSLTIATKFVDVSIADILNQLWPSFRGVLLMAPVTMAVLYLTASMNPFVQLALVVLSGVVSYLAVIWWIEREDLLRMVRALGFSR